MTSFALETSVNALLEAAERMAETLDEAAPEQLVAYVEERERLLEAIRAEAEAAAPERLAALRQTVAAVLERDRRVLRRMEQLRDEAAGKLKKAAQAKTQRSAYESMGPVESVFFDRKN